MERLRHDLAAAATFRSVGVTASIGVVADDSASSGIDELLERADAEMYRVKANRKRQVGAQ